MTKELSVSENAEHIAKDMVRLSVKVNNNIVTKVDRKSYAQKFDKAPRTITRWIKELEDTGLIVSRAKKTGNNGFAVYILNEDYVEVDQEKTNPYLDENFNAEQFRDLLSPKVSYTPERRYRSKEEIRAEKMALKADQDYKDNLNKQLMDMAYPTREWFNQLDEPERYYRAWTVSKMFDALTVLVPEQLHRDLITGLYEDGNVHFTDEMGIAQGLRNTIMHNSKRTSIPVDFVGDRNFTVFLKLVDFFQENKIDPLLYLTHSFNYSRFLFFENGLKKFRVPYVNTLLSDKAKDKFFNSKKHFDELAKRMPWYYSRKSPMKYQVEINYEILMALKHSYAVADRVDEQATLQKELKQKGFFQINMVPTPQEKSVLGYYKDITAKIADADLTEEETKEVKYFVEKNLKYFISRVPFSTDFVMDFPEAIKYNIDEFLENEDEGANIEPLFIKLGNVEQDFGQTFQSIVDEFKIRGYKTYASFTKHKEFYDVFRTIKSYMGKEIDLDILTSAMEKVGREEFPMKDNGTLDFIAISKQYLGEDIDGLYNANAGEVEFAYLDNEDPVNYDWYAPIAKYESININGLRTQKTDFYKRLELLASYVNKK